MISYFWIVLENLSSESMKDQIMCTCTIKETLLKKFGF